MSNRNITSASNKLRKDLNFAQKQYISWNIKEAIASNYKSQWEQKIKILESQIEELEPKTHEEANV